MWSFTNNNKQPEKPGETEVPDDVSGFTQLQSEDGEIAIDLIDICQKAIQQQKVEVVRLDGDQSNILHLPAFNVYLQTMGLEINPNENGVHVATRTDARAQRFEEGLVEYQHGMGDNLEEAIETGYRQWAQLDLPVICDVASAGEPESCMRMEMQYDENPGMTRQVYLGPTGHFAENGSHEPAAQSEEEHPFCPCCLVTNSMEAFEPLFKSDEMLGVRLFASRTETGELMADVRVNGHEFPGGVAALKKYAESWPGTGFEFRKQYAVFRSTEKQEIVQN